MATRSVLRTSLRQRLDDTSATQPLWSDATLNEMLAQALSAYSRYVPKRSSANTGNVAAAATSVALPSGVDEARVVGVRSPGGLDLPPMSSRYGSADVYDDTVGIHWRIWAGTVIFSRAIAAGENGVYVIEHITTRVGASDDVTEWPVEAGHELVVVLLAASAAMQRRAADDYKRGIQSNAMDLARDLRAEAVELIAPEPRPRLARGGTVETL